MRRRARTSQSIQFVPLLLSFPNALTTALKKAKVSRRFSWVIPRASMARQMIVWETSQEKPTPMIPNRGSVTTLDTRTIAKLETSTSATERNRFLARAAAR